MSNQVQLQNRIRVIADELEQGISNAEISARYCPLWSVSEVTVKRYIALAKDIVMGRMRNMDAVIEAARGDAVAEEAVNSLRSGIELEARLVSIIEGGLEVSRVVTGPRGTTETQNKPALYQVLRAIDMIWKRRGYYRPAGTGNSPKSGPVIKVEDEEQKKMVERVINLP